MSRGLRSSFHSLPQGTDSAPTLNSLSAACSERFVSPAYRVVRDDSTGTVWVSRGGSRLAIGLQPHMIERRGLAAVLEDADFRLSKSRVEGD